MKLNGTSDKSVLAYRIVYGITAIGVAVVLAVIGLVLYVKYGDHTKSMILKEFTQCIFPLDANPNNIDLSKYYLDKERKCYGYRYRIPEAYLLSVIPKNEIWQKVNLRLLYPDVYPWGLVRNKVDGEAEYVLDVIISPEGETFTERTENRIHFITSMDDGWEETESQFDWLRRYAPIGWSVTKPRTWLNDYFFSRDEEFELFFRCAMPFTYLGTVMDDLGCQVYTHIDNRLRVQYEFRRTNLQHLQEFHTKLMLLLRSFLVNPKINNPGDTP